VTCAACSANKLCKFVSRVRFCRDQKKSWSVFWARSLHYQCQIHPRWYPFGPDDRHHSTSRSSRLMATDGKLQITRRRWSSHKFGCRGSRQRWRPKQAHSASRDLPGSPWSLHWWAICVPEHEQVSQASSRSTKVVGSPSSRHLWKPMLVVRFVVRIDRA